MSEKVSSLLKSLGIPEQVGPLTDTPVYYKTARPVEYCGGTQIGLFSWRQRINQVVPEAQCTQVGWNASDSLVWGEIGKDELPMLNKGRHFLRLDNGEKDMFISWRA